MHARDIAKQYLKDRDKEKAAKAVEEMAGDDADELNKLRCLVNYYGEIRARSSLARNLRRRKVPIRPENKHRYPADWKLRSRFVRFYRARNRCEWCGAENYQPHPVTGSKVVLTTAHVYDDRPEAANLLNLAALCQLCHNGHDAKNRARGRRERRAMQAGQERLFT